MKFPLRLYRVSGSSMLPTYKPGDIVVAWRWANPRPGRTVVVKLPDRLAIKRIKQLSADGCWVEGDNPPDSTDSRHYGLLDRQVVQSVIIGRLRA